MGNLFCANEVIEMGIQILENGRDYYQYIARLTKNREIKETFNWLMKEEEREINSFREILGSVEKCEPFEIYDGEYASYIKSLTETYKYSKVNEGKETVKRIKDNGEAIAMAVMIEKDTMLFLHELQNVVRERERKVVSKLIKRIQEHITRLNKLKKCLTSADLSACLL